jgi:hypothetical protein
MGYFNIWMVCEAHEEGVELGTYHQSDIDASLVEVPYKNMRKRQSDQWRKAK